MTSYETQMYQALQRIYNLLNGALVPFLKSCTDFFDWIQEFFSGYIHIISFFGFGILFILILKWLSRW